MNFMNENVLFKMLMSVKKASLIVSKFALTPSVVLTVSVNLDMSWMTLTEKRVKKVFNKTLLK